MLLWNAHVGPGGFVWKDGVRVVVPWKGMDGVLGVCE